MLELSKNLSILSALAGKYLHRTLNLGGCQRTPITRPPGSFRHPAAKNHWLGKETVSFVETITDVSNFHQHRNQTRQMTFEINLTTRGYLRQVRSRLRRDDKSIFKKVIFVNLDIQWGCI